VSGSRPLPGVMSPRCSIASIVLRLADRGRISSLSFNRRRSGVAAERISFKLVPVLHLRQQGLFTVCEFQQETTSFLLRHSSRPFAGWLILHLAQSYHRSLRSATDAIALPEPEPRCGLVPHRAFDDALRPRSEILDASGHCFFRFSQCKACGKGCFLFVVTIAQASSFF
jgi:hypothetical protein